MPSETLRLIGRFMVDGKERSDFPGWGKYAKVWCSCGRHRSDIIMLDGTQELRCPVTGALRRLDVRYDALLLEVHVSISGGG